jgi:hypothetical protein
MMKKLFGIITILFALPTLTFAQEKNEKKEEKKEMKSKVNVPQVVKIALSKKYPNASKVIWETENGNYEANWGGKSGEDNSVQFTPDGQFIEIVKAIPINELPEPVILYVNKHYRGSKISEAGKVTDAAGKTSYEIEIKGKDVIFDENGKFIKSGK